MGATLSSPATLVVVVNQPTTFSGHTLTGTVYLDVRQPIDALSLVLMISGSEKTVVHYTTTTHSGVIFSLFLRA
jgi:hypothetical protein